MNLSTGERRYLRNIIGYTRELYGEKWRNVLTSSALLLPEQGLNEEMQELADQNPVEDEESVVESLEEKGVIEVVKKEIETGKRESGREIETDEFRRTRQEKRFIGIQEGVLDQLEAELDV
ncbi:MAG: hypothetical protein ABEJ98_00955 [Candidatus Nanohaloarchaea archaeon]